MIHNSEVAKHLIKIGVKQIVGVSGGGDSFEIIKSFINQGGDFLESPSEFSAPIIASAMNKINADQNYAVSISIRGPGLVSSLPGLYHNFVEDLQSLSISEGLSDQELMYNQHKVFDTAKAISSVELFRKKDTNFSENFNLNSSINGGSRMIHFTTRSNHMYFYNRSMSEMCCDKLETFGLNKKKKIFVIGKRGIENSEVRSLLLPAAPYFLTPAALPFADLNSPNFFGVWTGNEQFNLLSDNLQILHKALVVRVGVMQRELLTLQKNVLHFDIPLNTNSVQNELLEFLEVFGSNYVDLEKEKLDTVRYKIAKSAGIWSVYAAISIINELNFDINYSFDVGSFATIIENYIRPAKSNRLHSSFVGKFMGTAVPISLGISIAQPETPVLCMLGEGSLASSFNEIASIVSLQLPICILVFSSDNMHSIVGTKKLNEQFSAKFLPINYYSLEKTKISNLPTYHVDTPAKFASMLSRWDKKSPLLVFLKFDSGSYAKGVEFLR